MKKLICYFVLISSFLCGVGRASSSKQFSKTDLNNLANESPYQTIPRLFEKGLKNYDYKREDKIDAIPKTLLKAYPNRPDLQRQAIDAWSQCIRNQTVNGRKKYTEEDVQTVIFHSKKFLGLL